MAGTTTNYGWTYPTSTDLVKDGATAIQTLASGIDTTLGSFKNIRQVVTGTTSTAYTNATSTYSDTGLTATITPQKSTSQILVFVSQNGCGKAGATSLYLKLLVNGSLLLTSGDNFYTNSTASNYGSISLIYAYAPGNTSAQTFKTQAASNSNVSAVYAQSGGNSNSHIILVEVGP